MLISSYCQAESLYVFYPSNLRPLAMQKKLSASFPEFSITVFGKFKDLTKKIQEAAPDAILTKPFVIKKLDGFNPKLAGLFSGNKKEKYILLSIDKPVDLTKTSDIVIGIIDFLGRKGMKKFVSSIFNSPPKVKRTAKIENLLHMLTFNIAGSILIPERQIIYFKEKSNMNFVVTIPDNILLGIVEIAVLEGKAGSQIIPAFESSGKEVLSLFAVEKWVQIP